VTGGAELQRYLAGLRQDPLIETRLAGRPLRLRTTWGLFSPKAIDEGTALLLEHMPVAPDERALDLGCGYGPIGLSIAQRAPQGRAVLVDKDFVAVDYSRRNAEMNGIDNVEVRLSNGFGSVPETDFSLIASNVPAKSGKELYYLYFHDALTHLQPGGSLWVVSLSGLRRFVERLFREIFGDYRKIKQGKTYTVACATRSSAPSTGYP
jgi:16S rRNA G1207 methylase RsmC